MSITIRPATSDDQRMIIKLIYQELLNPIGLAWKNFLVAERNDGPQLQVVGIGQLRPHKDGSIELASMVVVEKMRGEGVGSALVKTLIARSATDYADRPLCLMCHEKKVGYYERFGFRQVGDEQAIPQSLRGFYDVSMGIAGFLKRFSIKSPSLAIMLYPKP